MKIVFFISSLRGGGAERVMTILCNNLVERGHQIFLITDLREEIKYHVDNRINLIDLKTPSRFDGGFFSKYYKFYAHIRQAIREIDPDLVNSFMTGMNFHVLISTIGLRYPIVVSEHSTFQNFKSWFNYFTRFYVYKLAEQVTMLTNQDYCFVGSRISRKVVIPNPLPYKINHGEDIRNKNILAVGSLDRWKEKGFENLIRIWGEVANKYPEWALEIAGTGSIESRTYLENYCESKGVRKSVRFLGFQKNIDKIMRSSTIFVLSSTFEGFGMVLLESMSQGCAAISFKCKGGPSEIIRHLETGLLVEDQNFNSMKESICLLIEDEKLRAALIKNAIIDVERFSADKIVEKLEFTYNEVLFNYRRKL
ncbi:glycosyltransferase family 4 protein [Algoriphagus jejuensis]|uniref:Glycosyltransferase family 4 protein n=1 Tax=Algoriphagus jejuensis TaxID=419934 RepID=A0ABN1N693_9BACT